MLYRRNKKNILNIVLIAIAVIIVIFLIWFFAFSGGGDGEESNDENVNGEMLNSSFSNGKVTADIDYMRGTIGLKEGDDAWKIISEEVVLEEGNSLKTADDSRAIITLGSSSEVRLDSNSEVMIASLDEDALVINQDRGSSYHYGGQLLDTYTLNALDAEIKPEGTAFAVEIDEDNNTVVVYALEGDVEVNNATIAEGYKISLEDGDANGVEEITDDEFDSEWFTWNDSRNSEDFNDNDNENTNENDNDNENENDNDNENTNENDNDNENENDNDNENTNENDNTNNEEENTNTNESADTGASLTSNISSIAAGGDGVSLKWNKVSSDEFKYYRVVRSDSNSSPSYPADGYVFYTGNAGEISFNDTTVQSGKTYYYRVCVIDSQDQSHCGSVQSATAK